MPSCSVPSCKNRTEKEKERGVTFQNLPAKSNIDKEVARSATSGKPKIKCFMIYHIQVAGGINVYIKIIQFVIIVNRQLTQ